ncbi:FAD-dependent oxidoreductase [Pseudomonas sp. NFX98]|uniref:FAD-dependent oxidoreductase n=1 Tax=Pseudomonas sp. NFX98 TaxID=3399122 RepID=UPI0039FD77F1
MNSRRDVLKGLILGPVFFGGLSHSNAKENYRYNIVIIGGGFAGATFAKSMRLLQPFITISLLEPNEHYYSCPMGAEYLVGKRSLNSLRFSYEALAKLYNISILKDEALAIDSISKTIHTQQNNVIRYDRCIVACGVGFKYNTISGYSRVDSIKSPHAWTGGKQQKLLRDKILGIPDGGVLLMSVPVDDYKCPPGPYERASLIAEYFKAHKPKSRIVILDAKNRFPKQAQFELAWRKLYRYETKNPIIEWISEADGGAVVGYNSKNMELMTTKYRFEGSVINIIPPQQAASFARSNNLTGTQDWCPVNTQTMESLLIPNIHVIGDCAYAEMLPKSAFAAACQARVCAIAISRIIQDLPPLDPEFANVCYSLCANDYAISVYIKYLRNSHNNILEISDLQNTPISSNDEQYVKEFSSAHQMFSSLTREAFL